MTHCRIAFSDARKSCYYPTVYTFYDSTNVEVVSTEHLPSNALMLKHAYCKHLLIIHSIRLNTVYNGGFIGAVARPLY